MAEHVVISHVLDEDAGVYRLVTGIPIVDQVPVVDANGDQVMDTDPETGVTSPRIEDQIVRYDDVFDYVFAANDKRWRTQSGNRRSGATVAAEQRQIVARAMNERKAPDVPTRTATELPGAGEPIDQG